MKRSVAVVATSAFVLALGGAATAVARPSASAGTLLTVSTTADAINGTVSSPAALIAHPGPDGISLREALTAAAHAGAAQPIAITFAPALVGKTIAPATFLPSITHDDVSLIGSTLADGSPAVTLDASGETRDCCSGVLAVYASHVRVAHLRIVNVTGDNVAIVIHAGTPAGEAALQDIRIEDNVLDDNGSRGMGMWVGTDFPGFSNRDPDPKVPEGLAANASLNGIVISHNTISGFTDDGINIGLPGASCTISGLVIADNTFSDNTGAGSPALELDTNYTANTIAGTQIVGNTFTGNWAGIHLNGGVSGTNLQDGSVIPATGNTISGTTITGNTFADNDQGITFNGGAAANAASNTVTTTEISNNVFARNAPYGAIGIQGGGGGAHGNRIDTVLIDDDTIAFNDGAIGIAVAAADGNQVVNVQARNTIFWANGRDIGGQDGGSFPVAVQSSLMGVDPRFVSTTDFHLQQGSPAIGNGDLHSTSSVDFDNASRDTRPDIGAFEFGAVARPFLNVTIDAVGGTGTVTSTPSGISCESSCGGPFDAQTGVTLTATPASGSRFVGWAGACSGSSLCKVTLGASSSVDATFGSAATKVPAVPKCKKGQKSSARKRCRR
jgi:hypothetical protein